MQAAIIYHSGFGHTKIVAEQIEKGILTTGIHTILVDVESASNQLDVLNKSNTIVFGSPTYFGNVSAEFKKFMESTGSIWYNQLWKNKLAAGFTHSSTLSGDKFHTLNSLFLFAAQHSMLWIPLGIMPQHDKTTGLQLPEPNGIGSYTGLMTYSGNDVNGFNLPLDLNTAFAFGKRIGELTKNSFQFNN